MNRNMIMYMMMSRNNQNSNDLLVSSMQFEVVYNFKYLRVNVNNNNNVHRELNEWIMCGNKFYYGTVKLLQPKLLSWIWKTRLYHNHLRPVITYTLRDTIINKRR
jgi:hypothetical protein